MRRTLILLCETKAFAEPRKIMANRRADSNENFIILNEKLMNLAGNVNLDCNSSDDNVMVSKDLVTLQAVRGMTSNGNRANVRRRRVWTMMT